MNLIVVTPPAAEPIDSTLLAAHLRLDDFTGQESIVSAIITAVRERAEAVTWRAIMRQTLKLTMDGFPGYQDAIILPRPPLAAVTSITYLDSNGVSQTLSSSDYKVDSGSEPARIVPVTGTTWPEAQSGTINTVEITYTAGYANAAAVPACIKQWMLLNAASLFEHRETLVVGQRAQSIELNTLADGLLEPVKIRRF